MRIELEFVGHEFEQLFSTSSTFYRARCRFGWRLENMRIDRNRRLAEGDVQDHVGGLAADPGQGLQRGAVLGYLGAVLSIKILQVAMTFLAFELNRPMVLMYFLARLRRGPASFPAYWQPGRVWPVALLTLTSVACADSSTEISSSKFDW